MNELKRFKERIELVSDDNYRGIAIELFNFQVINNPVYHEYVFGLGIDVKGIKSLGSIPFLPISLFKYRDIKSGGWSEEYIFESSGTSGMEPSRHYLEDLQFYNRTTARIFNWFYGNPENYEILALLPSYLERGNSSLVYMVQNLIRRSNSSHSGFYLSNLDELNEKIIYLRQHSDRKIMLWGVTFALLDLAKTYSMDLGDAIIIETGGMKGRGEEIVREEVHDILKEQFSVETIHSEYGMTELLSQAYSEKNGIFRCPPWMRVLTREINDPFCLCKSGQQGVINIIDLANIHSCAFIGTEDLGRVYDDGTFEVLGRLDNSDMRGCNLMIE